MKTRSIADVIAVFLVSLATMFIIQMAGCGVVHAESIPDNLAVRAILGEALHDDVSMGNLAHALRNRGDLRGVYGVKRGIEHYTPKMQARALKAWFLSASSVDRTLGADHWLSDYDLANCNPRVMKWRFKMVETLYQGQTHYYKEAL